ncbi:MAG: hypothetical protein ACKE51_00495 [Methylococcaceae bacterium]
MIAVVIFILNFVVFSPLYAATMPIFDVHFSVLTKNKKAHKKATLQQLKKEVDILNQYFITEAGEKIINFKFKSAHLFDEINASGCDFKRLGDSKINITAKQAKEQYYACNDEKIRDPLAINIFIVDSYSEKYGFEKYTTSVGAFNSGNQPYMLLDWARLDHTKLSPEEHEMGHCFGLGHICNVNATRDSDTNIMASTSQCKGSMGLRNIGFNQEQVKIIKTNAGIITKNFEKQYNKYKILDVFLKQGGLHYSDLSSPDYQHVYIYNNFRILYSTQGKNKLEFQTDLNKNTIPDSVENYMLQLVLGKVVLTNYLGFDDPLLSKKSLSNKRGAKYIDVKIREIKSKAYTTNKNIVDNFNIYKKNGLYSKNVISITLNRHLDSNNLYLIHELFHAYQNAKTRLRNDWFSEATANLVENLVKNGKHLPVKDYTLPSTAKDLTALFKMGYNAMPFWGKISYLCQQPKPNSYTLPNIKPLNFFSTQVNSQQQNWGLFLKTLLENLEKQTAIATKQQGDLRRFISKWEWPYAEQKSKKNNKYILTAVTDSMSSVCPSDNQEINGFLKLAANYLNITAEEFSSSETQQFMKSFQKCDSSKVKVDKNGILYSDYFDPKTNTINLSKLDCSNKGLEDEDLKGFSIIEHISGNIYLHRNKLTKLHFDNLKTVGGKITLSFNKLKSLSSLEKLDSVGNYISLQKNKNLDDISALRNLRKTTQLYIDNRKFNKPIPMGSVFCNENTKIKINKLTDKSLVCE